jgi:DHA1 family bicyclomycin/chloramphenicol resistance-like MFS transporter
MLFPALLSIQQDLGTSAAAVQQTVSLFFVANAFMCLWHGVLSDAWGRRKPLLIGLVVLVLTSLLCLLATRIEHLWILRTVQGWSWAWATSCAGPSSGICTAARPHKR